MFSVSKLPEGTRENHLHYSPIKHHKVYFLSILQVKDLIVVNLSAFSHAPLFDKAGVQKHFRRSDSLSLILAVYHFLSISSIIYATH